MYKSMTQTKSKTKTIVAVTLVVLSIAGTVAGFTILVKRQSGGKFLQNAKKIIVKKSPTTQISPTTPAPAAVVCGNNKLESGEECDDGNKIDDDGCSSVCKKKNIEKADVIDITNKFINQDPNWCVLSGGVIQTSGCPLYNKDNTYSTSSGGFSWVSHPEETRLFSMETKAISKNLQIKLATRYNQDTASRMLVKYGSAPTLTEMKEIIQVRKAGGNLGDGLWSANSQAKKNTGAEYPSSNTYFRNGIYFAINPGIEAGVNFVEIVNARPGKWYIFTYSDPDYSGRANQDFWLTYAAL